MRHANKTAAGAAMSSPSESRTGQLQVKHKQHLMYKKTEGSKRWHSIRATAAAVLTLPNSAIIESRPCRRMVTLSCLPRRYPALAAFGGSCPLFQTLATLGSSCSVWSPLATAGGTSRRALALLDLCGLGWDRRQLTHRVMFSSPLATSWSASRPSWSAAVLAELCGPYGALRSLWIAAVAVERLRSTLSAAVHAERCGPRCGLRLRSTLAVEVLIGISRG